MCGRFTLKVPVSEWLRSLFPEADIASMFGWEAESFEPRYNIAPTQNVWCLSCDKNEVFRIQPMRWGLVPAWADSLKTAYSMFNARSETLLEKASFKTLVSSQRCVILADGYYEWKTLAPKDKQPFWIHRPSEYPFGMAGLWARNTKVSPDGELTSATIITVPSNEDTRAVHDRMPAMLFDHAAITGWLESSEVDPESRMNNIIRTANSGTLELRSVAKLVNSARVEGPELIQTIA